MFPKFEIWTKLKGYTATIAGGKGGTSDGQGTLAQFNFLFCISMDPIGNIYVGDNCAIRIINATGSMGSHSFIIFK